jgi:hypothetical protein
MIALQAISSGWTYDNRFLLAQKPLEGEVRQNAGAKNNGLSGSAAQSSPKSLKGKVDANGLLPGHVGKAVIPTNIKLTKEEYKEALQQYSADLTDLVSSAAQYTAAVKQYDATVGACDENNKQYAAQVKNQQLNIQAVQIPTVPINLKQFDVPPQIPPPRVCCANCLITGRCGHLGTGGPSQGSVTAGMNAARIDAMRINESSAGLNKSQQQLKVAEAEQGFAAQKANQEAALEAKMQKLADMFGQLQEKYNIVKIEKDTLTGKVTIKK